MKTFTRFLLAAALINGVSCNKDIDSQGDNSPKQVSLEINVTNAPAKVAIAGYIEITIPQGAFSGNATFTIKPVDARSLPAPTDFDLFETYEVTSTAGTVFSKDIEIKIKYDPSKGRKEANLNTAGYYKEDAGKWIPFLDVTVDTVNNELAIRTNHLCKLGRFSYHGMLGYTDWRSSLHFDIYWTEPGVLTNAAYNSPFASVNVGPDPWYVQDIEYYLEQSWKKYKAENLSLPSGHISVYLKDLGSDDGRTSYLGNISIHQNLTHSSTGYANTAELLPMVCAHELLHYVQDYYYMQAFSEYTIKWWLEALAVQADRLVWPNNAKFEALYYASNLYQNLSRSWDDCNSDPEYYIAGGFLTYLINYREGAKLSLPEMIVECGKATNIAYIRSILNDMVRTKLGSGGLGQEYTNFIKWALKGDADIKLAPVYPTYSPIYPNFYSSILTNSFDSRNPTATLPHLSAAFFKGLNKTGEKQTMIAKIESKYEKIKALAYKMNDNGTAEFIRELNQGDSVLVELADDHSWVEVVAVNEDNDAQGNVTVNFRFKSQGVKTMDLSLCIRCNYITTYNSGGSNTGTNNYCINLGNLPVVQKGDTITANWDGMIDNAYHKGNATFIMQPDNTLTFNISDHWTYEGTVTDQIMAGQGMPRIYNGSNGIFYHVNETYTVTTSAWFKTEYPTFVTETTEFILDPQYPQYSDIYFYY